MSSSSSPAHLQPRDSPDFVSKPAIDTATPLVLRTEEQVAGQFTCGGPAAAYRGEWLCFEALFKAKDGIVVNLPSRKGSRQGWTLAVGTAVMLNAEAYSDYMHQVRADEKELNQLISSSWNAVSDKYFIAAASARSFVDVAFAKPLNFFVHSDITARPHLARIMSCAEKWITSLGNLDDVGKAKAPPIDLLASLILSEFKGEDHHKDWKEEYDDWYHKVGKGLEEAYRMATGTDLWHIVLLFVF